MRCECSWMLYYLYDFLYNKIFEIQIYRSQFHFLLLNILENHLNTFSLVAGFKTYFQSELIKGSISDTLKYFNTYSFYEDLFTHQNWISTLISIIKGLTTLNTWFSLVCCKNMHLSAIIDIGLHATSPPLQRHHRSACIKFETYGLLTILKFIFILHFLTVQIRNSATIDFISYTCKWIEMTFRR